MSKRKQIISTSVSKRSAIEIAKINGELIDACLADDIKKVDTCIEYGATNINTCLTILCSRKESKPHEADIAEMLLKKHVGSKSICLTSACAHKKYILVDKLLSYMYDYKNTHLVEIYNTKQIHLLSNMLRKGVEVLQALSDDVNSVLSDRLNLSAFYICVAKACAENNKETFKILLNKITNISIRDDILSKGMLEAHKQDHLELINYILDTYDINIENMNDIFLAACSKNTSIMLVERINKQYLMQYDNDYFKVYTKVVSSGMNISIISKQNDILNYLYNVYNNHVCLDYTCKQACYSDNIYAINLLAKNIEERTFKDSFINACEESKINVLSVFSKINKELVIKLSADILSGIHENPFLFNKLFKIADDNKTLTEESLDKTILSICRYGANNMFDAIRTCISKLTTYIKENDEPDWVKYFLRTSTNKRASLVRDWLYSNISRKLKRVSFDSTNASDYLEEACISMNIEAVKFATKEFSNLILPERYDDIFSYMLENAEGIINKENLITILDILMYNGSFDVNTTIINSIDNIPDDILVYLLEKTSQDNAVIHLFQSSRYNVAATYIKNKYGVLTEQKARELGIFAYLDERILAILLSKGLRVDTPLSRRMIHQRSVSKVLLQKGLTEETQLPGEIIARIRDMVPFSYATEMKED